MANKRDAEYKPDPNGAVQMVIEAGASDEEIKEVIEVHGHDAGVFVPAENCSAELSQAVDPQT